MTDEEAVALALIKEDLKEGGGDPARIDLTRFLGWESSFPIAYVQARRRAMAAIAALDANRQSAADRAATELNRIVYGDPEPL